MVKAEPAETLMPTMVLDASLAAELRADRVARGADRYDEVWEGVYMMAPMPNNEHQRLVSLLARCFEEAVGDTGRGVVFPGVNVSDRVDHWESNYRVPDIAVFLKESSAADHGAFWFGGPNLAVEITSRGDRSRDKLEFYAKVRTREVLIIDRDPWATELYRLDAGSMTSIGRSTPDDPTELWCDSVRLAFTFVGSATACGQRPGLRATGRDRHWDI